ncbi:MAG: DUF3179 domain-containing protein [bacterium]|nr:DUF3179 domain-containing protein [bacterium]
MKRSRVFMFLGALTIVLAACGGSSSDESPSSAEDQPTTTAGSLILPAQGALPQGTSALADMRAPDFPASLVDVSEIISGGPPPDGIPPIEEPVFLEVAENLELLEANEPVVALEINGDARAYPVSVMIWHEIVNDTVGGVPVSVTYCPLCNSAVTYGREINGIETTFGTSGRLFASALVMYDRATESLWTHFDGRSVVGVLTGSQLDVYGSPLMAWGDFRSAYPTGKVLDETQTGFSRRYGANPYVGYDDAATEPFLFRGALDDRARSKERIVGVSRGDTDVAYSLQSLSGDAPTATSVVHGNEELVILWVPGQSTALEGNAVDDGRDVGSIGVFLPIVDGRELTLSADGENFVDSETGSVWNVAGIAISGELVGSQLERIPHLDTFWFAWATYRPGSELVGTVG